MSVSRGSKIGPYVIVGVLGEGGGGVVYLAEQSEPVQREVALKVLRGGADSEQVVARFDAERQALAVMDHPSIAKVFDAGVSDDGRPYFVMELVSGASLAEYCDAHRLTVRERVRLFAGLCNAVQHAHQKGVIHRDLKPSNVLVSEVDGRPLPRIIDFGIAKATQEGVFDGTQLTRDDQAIGTPAYMSSEQVDGSGDVDTRTDVYALGVMLFEVLLGALPYEREAYRGWAAVAAQLHRDPPTPLARLAELGDTQETIASLRSTTPPLLRRELAGDLGWIVSRAMEKDRERRYETANAMALDLERFLNHEPVRARGATTAYVVGKFVRRNRLGVAFGATAAAGLVAFAVVTSVQSNRVAQARDEADARRGQAEGLIDFMLSDLRGKLEPIGQLDILDDVGDQAIAYFSSIPEDQASDDELASRSQALYQIGKVRLDQGDSESAADGFAESLRLARALSGRAPDDTNRLFGLSQSHFYVGYAEFLAGDFEAAEREFLGYLDAVERLIELDPENLDYLLELGFAHGNLGLTREARGDLAGAASTYELSLEAKRALVDRDSTNGRWIRELAETHNKLGVIGRKRGEYAGAIEQHAIELQLKRRLLRLDPQNADWRFRFAWALGYMAGAQRATGALEDALDLLGQQVAIMDSLVAHDDANARWRRSSGFALGAQASLLVALGRLSEAEASLSRALPVLEALQRDDPTASDRKRDLAWVHTLQAELALAMGQPEAVLDATDRAFGVLVGDPASNSFRTETIANAHRLRGYALETLGRPEESAGAWRTALATLDDFSSAGDGSEFRPLRAEMLLLLGRPDEADPELERLRSSGYVDSALETLREGGRSR